MTGTRDLGSSSVSGPRRLPRPAPITMGRIALERVSLLGHPARAMASGITFGIVTDLHFGPEARFAGQLRTLTALAPGLAAGGAEFLVNLGDDLEDESREADLARYGECQAILREPGLPLVNVAGNHDTVHLNRDDLNRFWQRSGPLYYSFDHGGWHFVVLHTLEKKDVEIRVPGPQIE